MKIKRFEARTMTEALRMVKKDFGEDAVILSATNAKKSAKIFSGMGNGQVVVTAAIDMTPAKSKSDTRDTGNDVMSPSMKPPSHAMARSPEGRGISILKNYQPITKTGRDKLKPKLVELNSGSDPLPETLPGAEMNLYQRLGRQGLSAKLAADLADQAKTLLSMSESGEASTENTLAQVIAAKGWAAKGTILTSLKGQSLVLVGAHGVGKTAAAVKLAAQCRLNGLGLPTVVTLDCQRAGAAEQLERMTRIMGIRLHVVEDHHGLDQIRSQMGEQAILIVDTPGISPGDTEGLEMLADTIKGLDNAQIHHVVHGGLQEKVIARSINFFRPLGVKGLFFTHLDGIDDLGPLVNQVEDSLLPVSFLSAGAQVPDGLVRATPLALAQWALTGRLESRSETPDVAVTVVAKPKSTQTTRSHTSGERQQYVANCNSDIFHEVSCKSVQRMNPDHILTFADALDAKAQGFKPCRVCCAELLSNMSPQTQIRTHQSYRRQVI